MKISVEQSGGYAGQTIRVADIDTARLDTAAAQEVEQMVRQVGAQSAQTAEPLGADLLRYTITVSDGGATRTIRFTDDGSAEASPLRELVSTLTERGNR